MFSGSAAPVVDKSYKKNDQPPNVSLCYLWVIYVLPNELIAWILILSSCYLLEKSPAITEAQKIKIQESSSDDDSLSDDVCIVLGLWILKTKSSFSKC